MFGEFLKKYSHLSVGLLGIILINMGLDSVLKKTLPINWYVILNTSLLGVILSALFLLVINRKNKLKILGVITIVLLIVTIDFFKGYFSFWKVYNEASNDLSFYNHIQLNFPEAEKHVNYDSYFAYLSGTNRWTLMFRAYLLNGLTFLMIFFTGNWLRSKIMSSRQHT